MACIHVLNLMLILWHNMGKFSSKVTLQEHQLRHIIESNWGSKVNWESFSVHVNYRPPTKLREGNILIQVCLSTGREGSPCGHYQWCMMHWTPPYSPPLPTWDMGPPTSAPRQDMGPIPSPNHPLVLTSGGMATKARTVASYWNASTCLFNDIFVIGLTI